MNTGPGIPYADMSGGYYAPYNYQRLPTYQQPYPPRHVPPSQPSQPPPQSPPSPTYSLRIEQGPERAKLVGKDKTKDRKPIDPPPIIRCVHSDSQSSYDPHLFCSVTLFDDEKDEPKQSENVSAPLLVGATVSSAHRLKALNNDEGTFFVFGDLAPGVVGKARLHFVVFKTDTVECEVVQLASVTSERFEVSNSKDWDGVKESTVLSRTFADQGVKLRLRKESRNGRRNLAPTYQPMPSGTAAPMLLPNPSSQVLDEDDDSDGRGGKRQRLSFPGQGYAAYPATSQMAISSYQAYNPQDAPSYAVTNAPSSIGYNQMQMQSAYTLPHHFSRQQASQAAPVQYSPQSYQYRHRPSQYISQQSQYSGYGLASNQQYSQPTYAPVNSSQQQQSGQPSQQPQYVEAQPSTPTSSSYSQTGAQYGHSSSQYSHSFGQYLNDPVRAPTGSSRHSGSIPPLQTIETDEQSQRTLPSLRHLQYGASGQETPSHGSVTAQQHTPRNVLPPTSHGQFAPLDYPDNTQ